MDIKYLKKFTNVVGCDEVGRGPIAGPVNAAAVRIDSSKLIKKLKLLNVTDSKKLSHKKRESILNSLSIYVSSIKLGVVYDKEFLGEKYSFCVTEISPKEIDKINILKASLKAMGIASHKLADSESVILIDGNKIFESEFHCEPVIKGDSKVIAIGLASIIAKVFRDKKMSKFETLYPGYSFRQNAGYPTKEHRDAVKVLGITPIHRKSFKGVKEYI